MSGEKVIDLFVTLLQFLALFYDIVTLPIYYILQTPWNTRQKAWNPKGVLISKDEKNVTYRTTQKPEKVHVELIRQNVTTMAEMLTYYSKKYAAKRCLGTRELLEEYEEVQPNGKVFIKNHLGEYIWKTYAQVNVLAANFGMGMRELGLKSGQNVAIFSETRSEWMIAAHGLFKQNMPIVTVYANLGDEGIIHALNETRVSTVITSHELMGKFQVILKQVPLLNTLIYMENQLVPHSEADKLSCSKLRVLKFSDVLKLGSISHAGNNFPNPGSTGIIMYTSGSTGTPKGVILSHSNLVASLRGFGDAAHSFNLCDDILIGFLPLAHVFELIVESVCLCSGIAIGYSSAYTMIDSSTKIKPGTRGDAPILRPTIMTAVPLILDRISKGIQEKVSKKNLTARVLYHFAYEYKKYWWNKGYDTPILNRLIFRKVTEILGGRLRLILSGGAPLAPETHERIQLCLCANVIQGYGLTESTACATVMDRSDRTFGRVGGPTTVCDIRLQTCDDEGYTIRDRPYPQGEILVGGENVSRGYYALETKTKEDFFDDEKDGTRWFRTGDVGQIHADGVMQIIDRKKDLLKMQAGEYVSLGKVEMEMKLCPLVENICVYGEPQEDRCVALIVPNERELSKFAEQLQISATFPDICDHPKLKYHVLKKLIEHGKKRKLQRFELPTDIKICKELWTPDNNLVTAAFKIRRKQIKEYYQMDIDKMYHSGKRDFVTA